jgi:CubicO group peptidase (beta-lactamase class C family)
MKVFLGILKWVSIVFLSLVAIIVIIFLVNTDLSNPENTQKFLENKIGKAGIRGISIAMIKDDQIISTYQAGYANVEENHPVEKDTIFQIASVSKTITGTAVVQLHEQGKLDLDDDINDYLPFSIRHPNIPDSPITFRMLLSHTAGMDNNWEVYDTFYTISNGGGDSSVSLGEFIEGFFVPDGRYYDAAKNFTKTGPGEAYQYSNPAYALLGYLVEQISRQSFPEYCQDRIFEPLDMPNTTWLLADTHIENLAIPYEGNEALPHYSFATYPDGTLKTTPTDYAHFLIAMMNDGRYKGNQILQPETIVEMLKPIARDGLQALTWDYGLL